MQHTAQIRQKLGVTGIITSASTWRSKKSDPAVQIDLLIERNDGVINICEMKYANDEFVIDKEYDDVYLDEFDDEIDDWVIDALKALGCFTAKGVLALSPEEIIERADIEEQIVREVLHILQAEI